jgi:hypothetical protein
VAIRRRRFENKIQDVLGEDQFGFTRGKRIRDVTGMLRVGLTSEQILEIEELGACSIDWYKPLTV